jgi:hypothetical protein
MARMIPAIMPEQTESDAEKRLFPIYINSSGSICFTNIET